MADQLVSRPSDSHKRDHGNAGSLPCRQSIWQVDRLDSPEKLVISSESYMCLSKASNATNPQRCRRRLSAVVCRAHNGGQRRRQSVQSFQPRIPRHRWTLSWNCAWAWVPAEKRGQSVSTDVLVLAISSSHDYTIVAPSFPASLSCLVLRKTFSRFISSLEFRLVRWCASLPSASIVAKSAIARALRIRPKAAYMVGDWRNRFLYYIECKVNVSSWSENASES